ncbi:MAG: high frequency lysogenization protein HflD [Natronospirillum sp.]|uniref:high frequency lysogenization protein HflD n=1 Tax=Natronospirillum sp. TaxID=2812955 RepID=UPI0025E57C04|nr:high frequency lysogenization protein HflD [Natronospirillum sp.]MCH8551053.1 high frequency lysogenization protein HflD [Natronospirillum sp.]
MSQHDIHEQALALAGVFQAASMVERIARQGQCPADEMTTAVNALLNLNPASTEDVFGSAANLRSGLTILRQLLSRQRGAVHNDIVRYAMSLLHLENRLRKKPDMLSALGDLIQQSVERKQYFQDPLHDAVVGSLARNYQDTLSKLKFRIQVTGNPSYLNQQRHADQIRMLLLFGVRSALLWRQVGGRRLQLLLGRRRLLYAIQNLLTGQEPHEPAVKEDTDERSDERKD